MLQVRPQTRCHQLHDVSVGIVKVDAAPAARPVRLASDRNVGFHEMVLPRGVVGRGDGECEMRRLFGIVPGDKALGRVEILACRAAREDQQNLRRCDE